MKRIYRKLVAAMVLTVATGAAAHAQTADLVLTGAPNMGNYPGYVTTGTFDATFTNATGVDLASGSFRIVLTLPAGFDFDASYPGLPSGWSYTRISATTVHIQPTSTVYGAATIVPFFVPFKTTQAVAAQPYLGQIQPVLPVYTDPNSGNNTPSGNVSVQNVPLPVSFTHFEAQAAGCKTELSWSTGQERNNKYFSVERSDDGLSFKSIGKIDAAGTATQGSDYSYTDESPVNGKSFYRIAQYDMDGKVLTTHTLPVTINCGETKIEMFPNPATEIVNVKGLSGTNTIRIFNIAGQEVAKAVSDTETRSVKVNGLSSGTYHVQVVKNNEIIFNGKFVKAD